MPSPSVAATKASTTSGRSPAKANPRVSSDEPLRVSASRGSVAPSAQNMGVKATTMAPIHTPGSVIRATGAYRAMIRSASSHVVARRTRRSNTRRTPRKTARVRTLGSALGTTTVRSAEPSTLSASAVPARNARTRAATSTAPNATDPGWPEVPGGADVESD